MIHHCHVESGGRCSGHQVEMKTASLMPSLLKTPAVPRGWLPGRISLSPAVAEAVDTCVGKLHPDVCQSVRIVLSASIDIFFFCLLYVSIRPRLETFLFNHALHRATLCVSAVFAVARCLSAVCPSVRPSVTFVYCIQTADDIVRLFCGPVAPPF